MKRTIHYLLFFLALIVALGSCRTVRAPRLDYRAIATASKRLGMDIGYKDNHALYIAAASWIGVPYRSGGSSKRGTDCSGFTSQIYKEVYHTTLSRSSQQQWKDARKVSKRHLREGDLVFFGNGKRRSPVTHVGIYLKDGKFIHASTSRGVMVSRLSEPYYAKRWKSGGRM